MAFFGNDGDSQKARFPIDISKETEWLACITDYKPHRKGGGLSLVFRVFNPDGSLFKPLVGKKESVDRSLSFWDDDSGQSRNIVKALFPEVDWESDGCEITVPDDLVERWAIVVLEEQEFSRKDAKADSAEKRAFKGQDDKTIGISYIKPVPSDMAGVVEKASLGMWGRPAPVKKVGMKASDAPDTPAAESNPWG